MSINAEYRISLVRISPKEQNLVKVGFVAAERILYVPSIGFCVLVALGARQDVKLKLK